MSAHIVQRDGEGDDDEHKAKKSKVDSRNRKRASGADSEVPIAKKASKSKITNFSLFYFFHASYFIACDKNMHGGHSSKSNNNNDMSLCEGEEVNEVAFSIF